MHPMMARFAAVLMVPFLLCSYLACGGQALQSNEIRFELRESPVLVKETGTIIVDKRQVATLLPDGKVVDSHNKPLAWLRENNIRLRGGGNLQIQQTADGVMYLSKQALEAANLKPVAHHVRADGFMATTKNSRGVQIKGAKTDRVRRIVLLILLMDANDLWPQRADTQADDSGAIIEP